jgi:hypothetical protein
MRGASIAAPSSQDTVTCPLATTLNTMMLLGWLKAPKLFSTPPPSMLARSIPLPSSSTPIACAAR